MQPILGRAGVGLSSRLVKPVLTIIIAEGRARAIRILRFTKNAIDYIFDTIADACSCCCDWDCCS